jgi:hypothetical protein
VSAELTIRREGVIAELRGAPLEIELDGTTVGSINRHETFEAPIEPGHHTLQIRGRPLLKSSPIIQRGRRGAVSFRCYGGRIWPIYATSFWCRASRSHSSANNDLPLWSSQSS